MKRLIVFLAGAALLAGCPKQDATPKADAPKEQKKEAPKEAGKEKPKEAATSQGGGKKPTAVEGYDAAEKPEADMTKMLPKNATEKAPDQYKAVFDTTAGKFTVEVTRKWAPNGADRFYNMVKLGYFNDIAVFRAIKNFMFQFGIHGNPDVNKVWSEATIKDDKNFKGVSNKKGFLTFARTGAPDSRSTQLFINLGDNGRLDPQGFTPFGKVVEGQDVLDQINTQYGENPPPFQGQFQEKGNAYAKMMLPKISYIKSVTIAK